MHVHGTMKREIMKNKEEDREVFNIKQLYPKWTTHLLNKVVETAMLFTLADESSSPPS